MSKNKLKYKDFSYYDLSNNDLSNIRYTNFNCKNPNTKKKEYYRDDTTPILNDQLCFININYKNTSEILITTPVMTMPFKINENNGSFIMNLQFTNYKDDPNMNKFYNFMRNLELQHIKHIGLDESNIELYLPQIRRDKDEKYDPNLVTKLPFRYSKFECDAYNRDGELINILNISRFSKMQCDIFIDKIWVFNDQYICKWKVKTIQLL